MAKKFVLSILAIVFPVVAFAGTWGVGSYENDMAQDWYLDISGSPARGVLIERALNVPPAGYLDADQCSIVFAAAEILVATRTEDLKDIPFEGNEWILSLSRPDELLLKKARVAIGYCLDDARSELAELWKDSQDFETWRVDSEAMVEQLQ